MSDNASTIERVEIGKVCYKGGSHASFVGEADHGSCGSHYYATVYLTVEIDYDDPRGESCTANEVADELRQLIERDVSAGAEVTDEMVEAAAGGMWDRHGEPGMFPHAPEHMRASFRKDAHAALSAALGERYVEEGDGK